MTNGNGKLRLIIYIALAVVSVIAALKAWILLPEQVATQAAQNIKEHIEYEEDIDDLDSECMALNMDVVEIKSNIRHIMTEQTKQEQRQIVRDEQILDEIKALHR